MEPRRKGEKKREPTRTKPLSRYTMTGSKERVPYDQRECISAIYEEVGTGYGHFFHPATISIHSITISSGYIEEHIDAESSLQRRKSQKTLTEIHLNTSSITYPASPRMITFIRVFFL